MDKQAKDWDDFSYLPEEELEKLRDWVKWFMERHPGWGSKPTKIKVNLDIDYNYKNYYELNGKNKYVVRERN